MNLFKAFYCRTFQIAMRTVLPILPYREPKILETNEDVVKTLKELNHLNILLVTDKGIKNLGLTVSLEEEIKKANINLFVFDEVVPNPTTENVANALKVYKENNCSAIIAFGGGSVMDCAKAVGARVARPNKPLSKMKGILKVGKKIPTLIAVPTTAGTGSETTLAAVITDAETRHKYAISDFPLIPRYALLDANLTVGLPLGLTATTGMDALTHAVEAYIGRSTTRHTKKCAMDATKLIFENLNKVCVNGKDLEARKNMLKAAYLAGVAFTQSYVGYVHAIAHSLGGKYNTAHGLANAVILPYVLKSYGKKIFKKLYDLGVYAGLFSKETSIEVGSKIFIEKIEEMNRAMNIPTNLPEIKQEDIEELAKTAEKEANPLYPVPVLYTAKQLEKIYYQVKGE